MKNLAGIVIALLLYSCFVTVGLAQKPKAKKSRCHDKGWDHTEYDKAKDETTVFVVPMPVYSTSVRPPESYRAGALGETRFGTHVTMTAYYTYTGKAPVTPTSIVITFIMESENIFDPEDRDLSITADDERFDLGRLDLSQSRTSGIINSLTHEDLLEAHVPYETFLRIARAEKVTVRLGVIKFKLGRCEREHLGDLASRIQP